jgi:glycerol-3-phosphate O-acyltransferase/dihydroxyacetone phosphate acyltransferase
MLYHTLRHAARSALRWYYADIVIQGADRVPAQGPLLVVANHPNALVDALLVSTTLERRILLTAKATLFEHPFLARLLRAVGVVPLRRAADERAVAARQDGSGSVPVTRNTDAFAQVRAALAAGGAVLVFPEGISHDAPAIAPLRTGAARMAFDAAGRGVRQMRLLPLGLVFERKEQLRSRVLVRIGPPIDLDAWCAAHPAAGATQLTEALDVALRAVTLNFASDERAKRAVRLARALAAIVEAPPALAAPRELATETEIAERIERATDAIEGASEPVVAQVDAFVARLGALDDRLARRGATLADLQVSPRLRHGARFLLREGALAALAVPIAALGRVTHWLPLRLSRSLAMRGLAADPSRDQPAMRTIVLGLVAVLLWYLAQLALVAHWLGVVAGVLWVVAISIAARIDLQFADRLRRARARARTYLVLRRDPAFREEALAAMHGLLEEALTLECALTGRASAVRHH